MYQVPKKQEEEAWLVDGLLKNRRKRNCTMAFLVQWAGNYEPAWVLRANLAKERISPYFSRKFHKFYDGLPVITSIRHDSAVPSNPLAEPSHPFRSPVPIHRKIIFFISHTYHSQTSFPSTSHSPL